MKTQKIVGVCGSIREQSSSQVVLDEFVRMLPSGFAFEQYRALASIPAFDGSDVDPSPVKSFKTMIKNADGIVICTPEYAFGVPGALKNALDWTVGTGEFVNKPIALITASSQGEKGHESLQHTLRAISATLHPESTLLISFVRAKVKDGKVTDIATQQAIQNLANSFTKILKS
jgi:chromate reductase, NAD(P)H dehydrogenase (quinone)